MEGIEIKGVRVERKAGCGIERKREETERSGGGRKECKGIEGNEIKKGR